MRVLEYGTRGPLVVLLHGGPGAPGYLAPLAEALAPRHRVLEPYQRRSGGEPLTVARHVADLRALLDARAPAERPAVVGHSWGAMLALAWAAEHPGRARSLALVGCGTFEPEARRALEATRAARTDDALRARLDALAEQHADPDERLRAAGELYGRLDARDPAAVPRSFARCDARGHAETWSDALRLQTEGRHPAAFAAVDVPVRMLHGADDPHPGRRIHAGLARWIERLDYHELPRCGHYPWLEPAAREAFLAALEAWLDAH